MKLLLDSNVIIRWSDSKATEHEAYVEALNKLAERSNVIYVCAQVIIESYVVMTRPVESNGLGFSIDEAKQTLDDIEGSFPCLPEPSDIAVRWRKLIEKHLVMGRQAHDTRIAAIMTAYGIKHLLTLNPNDFDRYQTIIPLTPSNVISR